MSTTFLSLASTLGWAGALGTVLAYALVSLRVLSVGSRSFQGLNATGAALLTISAVAHDSWPSAASNLVWVVIALAALVRSRGLTRAAGEEPAPAGAELVAATPVREDAPVGV